VTTRRAAIAAFVALVALAAAVPPAPAAFLPGAQIVSVDNARDEQGDGPTGDAVITPDGRYVVIATRATNFFADDDPDPANDERVGGIFRYDRLTGAIVLVADGDLVTQSDGTLVTAGATAPSVSADGRFVVFATAQRLVPQDTNDNIDVYVRDMNVPLTANRQTSGAYTLVSARSGGDAPATYAPAANPTPGRALGSTVFADAAISADGTRVVFRTQAASDLASAAGTTTTPAGALFVRDLRTKTTTLMTRNQTDGSPVGGAGPAVISGDGSTVVWAGTNAVSQTRFVAGEHVDDLVAYYLWRRLDGTVTRRITGLADPDDPNCTAATPVTTNPLATGPCYGPLTDTESGGATILNTAPAVSQDGYTIAFLASGGLRPIATWGSGLDLFVTHMNPGLTRKQSTTELTRDGATPDLRTAPPILAVAMSADGRYLVIATSRVNFILPTLAPIATLRAQPDDTELYEIDLQADTLDRVTTSLTGGDTDGDAGTRPTVDADGSLVAYTSTAANLLFGDANGVSDAFVATRAVQRASNAPPPGANTQPGTFDVSTPATKHVTAKATSRPDGSVRLAITTPGSGTLSVAVTMKSHKRSVSVARVSPKPVRKGTTTVTLRLAATYARLLKKGSVHASARVTYQPGAGLALHRTVAITFKVKVKAKAKKHR
jgi:hypothetical protein